VNNPQHRYKAYSEHQGVKTIRCHACGSQS
jgi:hypothetical protein